MSTPRTKKSKSKTTPPRGSGAIHGPATEFFEPGPWQDFDKVVRWDGVQGYENDTLPDALERARAYAWRLATELDGDDKRLPHWWQHRPMAAASRVEILDRILERHWTTLEVRHPGAFSRLRTEVEALRQTADRFGRGAPVDVQGAAHRLHGTLETVLEAVGSGGRKLITLAVAQREFAVSRATLYRAIKDGTLKSYRRGAAAQHLVDPVEVAGRWPRPR